ncbi:MAG: flagellar hook-length control protein FliK [Arcobacter sp.]|uniref:flagellar hook-length control protein FliK n=1 Tax=Arcobacter sp. TaxID=1872629 RepID=UPI003B005560
MLVSTNTQLNILVANKTSNALKEVLKEADVKTLTSQNKDFNVSTLLKTLFNNVQNSAKSNETVLKLLKNSNLSKDLGSFTSNLQSLVKALPDDKSTQELKTFLQKFSITPDQATPKNVEGQIQKSGIFLESKLLNQSNNPNAKNENSLLNDMKTVLLKTKAQLETLISNQSKTQTQTSQKVEITQNNPQATQNVSKENINTTETLKQIDKLLTQLKTLDIPNIKEQVAKPNINAEAKPTQQTTTPQIIKSDSPIINDIKTLLTKVQAQLQNQVSSQTQTSQKAEITQNNPQATQNVSKENINTTETLKQIDKLLTQLKTLDIPNIKEQVAKPTQQTTTPQIIKSDSPIINDIKTLLTKVQAQLQNQVSSQTQTSQKAEITQNNPQATQNVSKENINTTETLKQIDKLLTQLKTLDIPNIKEQVAKPNINAETKPTQQATTPQIIKSDSPIINDIKTLLTKVQAQLQNQVVTQSQTQTQTPQKAEVAQNNPQATQERVQAQSTSQLLQMKVDLKAENQTQALTKESINNNETLKQIDKLLGQLKNLDPSKAKEVSAKNPIVQDNKATLQTNAQPIRSDSPIFNDIKTLLSKVQAQIKTQIGSQAQEELKALSAKESDPAETLKQVDKLLTQIDYHQLYSIANSSNNVYIPFLWDLLEDGSIDIKKIDEEKFYCLIDLTLKDLGKINLHLYLYDDDKLDVSIFVEKDDTKQLIRQKATALKRELNGTAISVIGLNVYTLKEDSKENIYTQNDNFDFGVNIKV